MATSFWQSPKIQPEKKTAGGDQIHFLVNCTCKVLKESYDRVIEQRD